MATRVFSTLFLLTIAIGCCCSTVVHYQPSWESLDSRPLPNWYDQAKFGIFIHWGVYSVPSVGSEWFWWEWKKPSPDKEIVNFMEKNYPPNFQYADFAHDFTAEFFNPDQWADLLEASGAKYVVLTSKHHEGYTLWPSNSSWNWNSVDLGPNRDLVGDFAKSIRNRTKMHFGLYHSLFEWFNPLYLLDKDSLFKTQTFPNLKSLPELYDLVSTYKPELIWSDGEWEAPDTYWKSKEFLAWLYNDSPVKDTVVTNDRWGSNCLCRHGGYYTCSDRYSPGVLQPHKWENCMTIDRQSWGYRRNALLKDYFTIEELISNLASTVSCGGNLLMNIGPTKEGTIIPIFEERLRQMGQWLAVNGEAIYDTIPWYHQNDTITPGVWYTSKIDDDGSVIAYAIVLNWPRDTNILGLQVPQTTEMTEVTMLGVKEPLIWTGGESFVPMMIKFPEFETQYLPWAWVLKMTNLKNIKPKNLNLKMTAIAEQEGPFEKFLHSVFGN